MFSVATQAQGIQIMAQTGEGSVSASNTREARVIAVSSGKGGVGKTNLVANLGIAFARTGAKVLLDDPRFPLDKPLR